MLLRTAWTPGPLLPAGTSAPASVLVAVTGLRVERRRELGAVYRAGWRLRALWPELDGALGLWLWSRPLAGDAGSVSVWRSQAALRRFLALAEHVRVMRVYRDRVHVWSTTWTTSWTAPHALWPQARGRLTAAQPRQECTP